MGYEARGYAAYEEKGDLRPYLFKRRSLREDDVLIHIECCGVCHSDIHTVFNDWKSTTYPIVPGHEIVGRVIDIGSSVKKYKKDQRVGIGVKVDSCGSCDNCHKALEQYCTKGNVSTYNGKDYETLEVTQGGYSNIIVTKEKFVFDMPTSLDPSGAAPLLCAGITTYSPLKHFKVQKGSSVGIVGLGGLGHMGVKLAKAMGAEVSVFTTSPEKEKDAKRLGADQVFLSKDPSHMERAKNSLNFILNTVAAPLSLEPYFDCLKTDGVMTLVGLPEKKHPPFSVTSLIYQRRSLAGSLIGGTKETQEMLYFCEEHNIVSDVEIISIEEINQAFQKTIQGQVKYRFVIDMSTLK